MLHSAVRQLQQISVDQKHVRGNIYVKNMYFNLPLVYLKKKPISLEMQHQHECRINSRCPKAFLHSHSRAAVWTFSPQPGWCEPQRRV